MKKDFATIKYSNEEIKMIAGEGFDIHRTAKMTSALIKMYKVKLVPIPHRDFEISFEFTGNTVKFIPELKREDAQWFCILLSIFLTGLKHGEAAVTFEKMN